MLWALPCLRSSLLLLRLPPTEAPSAPISSLAASSGGSSFAPVMTTCVNTRQMGLKRLPLAAAACNKQETIHGTSPANNAARVCSASLPRIDVDARTYGFNGMQAGVEEKASRLLQRCNLSPGECGYQDLIVNEVDEFRW
ncbi:hypothetical protein GOP47_0024055 [Adiantum capillus-veneris]|uniref:Uncharacterized protein n=1 Tax=Adiantum capillus-veneris TaxID=13818 RepID=A0A9D4U569_ADICA|nr:hypothetical protein GOP47_0024055 [Adiantum capillus-veneris]